MFYDWQNSGRTVDLVVATESKDLRYTKREESPKDTLPVAGQINGMLFRSFLIL